MQNIFKSVWYIFFLLIVIFSAVSIGFFWAYYDEVHIEQSCFHIEQKIIRGYSMEPFLHENDTVQALMKYYDCHEVERGDIVLAEYPGHENGLIIKTIKAIPGDALTFIEDKYGWHIVVNGITLTNRQGEMYVFSESKIQLLKSYDVTGVGVVQAPWYLLMGEMPEGSSDSSRYGLFPKDMIVGKVVTAQY